MATVDYIAFSRILESTVNSIRLITDTMLDDFEIQDSLIMNDKDDKRTQIDKYIKEMKKDHTWLSYNELNMFYKLTKLNIILHIARYIKGDIKNKFGFISEAETMYVYKCSLRTTSSFQCISRSVPNENNRRIIKDINNRLVTVRKEVRKTQI